VPCLAQAEDPFADLDASAALFAQIGASEATGWSYGEGGQHLWFLTGLAAPLVEAGVIADST
jgi:hypothetical protein